MLTKYFKLFVYNCFSQPINIIEIIFKLNFETISKIQAFHCTHLFFRYKGQYKFDSDVVEVILDIWYSASISFELRDFIKYQTMDSEVKGIGIHKIVGIGTLNHTFADDTSDQVDVSIKDAIHIPIMNVMLISLQKIAPTV